MEYEGKLDLKEMNGEIRRAYLSWQSQRARCHNKKYGPYKNYGAKGIRVLYTSRQFIGWWVHNIKNFKGTIPTVGRIDHDSDYSFHNIILQDKADNTREVLMRRGSPRKLKIALISLKTKKPLIFFKSIIEASKSMNLSRCTIRYSCQRGLPSLHGFLFQYFKEVDHGIA